MEDALIQVVPADSAEHHPSSSLRRLVTNIPMQMVALALVTRTALFALAWHFGRLIPPVEDMGSPSILTQWGQWDTWHYVTIALYGYDRSPDGVNTAFFPVYPSLISIVERFFGEHLLPNDYRWVAVLISLVFMLAATYTLTVLFLQLASPQIAVLGVVLFLISPFSFFLNAGYTESTFVFLIALTFVLGRDKRWFLAAVVVAVATATRVSGVFLIPTLLLMAWNAGLSWKKLAGIAAVSPMGLLLYMVWQWVNLGSPLKFYTVQSHCGGFEDRTGQYVRGFVDSPLHWTVNNLESPTLLINVGVCVLWISTLWPMYKRFGLEITFFSALLIAQSALFVVSQGRFLLPTIGVYITLAAIVEERPHLPILKYGLIGSFLMTMTMLALMFTNGQWIV